MFKLCKWLIQYMFRPYKKFEHLMKCLDIFIKWAKQMSEKKKGKIKQKKKKTYLAPRARPSRPSPPPRACRLPQAARQRAVCPACPRRRRGLLPASPVLLLASSRVQEKPSSLPPPFPPSASPPRLQTAEPPKH